MQPIIAVDVAESDVVLVSVPPPIVTSPVAVNAPTTVEDACATAPPVSVERPLTLKVPNVAVFPLRVVEVAVPKVPTPVTLAVVK